MFYSTEILTRRKGGFGVYWLAATIGSKGSSFRKLSRKEIVSCDVVKACQRLVEPDEPLALRLSSNLMVGIARVYSQQYQIYQADVTNMMQAVKKAFSSIYNDTGGSLDMTAFNARPEAITLNSGAEIDVELGRNAAGGGLGLDGFYDDYGWRLLEERLTGRTEEDGIVDCSVDDSMPRASQKFVADPAQISLPEAHLHDDYLLGPGQQDEEMARQDAFNFDFDLGAVGDLGEQGIFGGVDPELDAAMGLSSEENRFPSSSVQGGPGFIVPTSDNMNQNDFRPMDLDAGFDVGIDIGGVEGKSSSLNGVGTSRIGRGAGGGRGGQGRTGAREVDGSSALEESDFEERVKRQHEEAARADDAMMNELIQRPPNMDVENDFSFERQDFMDIDFGVPQGPYTPPRPGSLTALKPALRPSLNRSPSQIPQPDGANPVVPQKRKKGRKTVVLDPVVGMSTEQIMHSREAYPTEMERLNGLARVSERTKREKDLASQLVFGVPLALSNPFLADFWKSHVKLEIVVHREKGSPKRRRIEEDNPAREDDGQRQSPALPAVGPGEFEYPFGDVGMFDAGQDQDYGVRASSVFQTDREPELGRRGTDAGSQRSSIMPWNAPPASSGMSDFGAGGIDLPPSSQTGTSKRVASLDTPVLARIGQGGSKVLSSTAPSNLGSESPTGRPREPSELAVDAFEAWDVPMEGLADDEPFKDAEITAATLEKESANFLEYARRQALDLHSNDFLFSDIVPISTTAPNVAAQAFYHLLALSTKGLIQVRGQETPFGEIHITIS